MLINYWRRMWEVHLGPIFSEMAPLFQTQWAICPNGLELWPFYQVFKSLTYKAIFVLSKLKTTVDLSESDKVEKLNEFTMQLRTV